MKFEINKKLIIIVGAVCACLIVITAVAVNVSNRNKSNTVDNQTQVNDEIEDETINTAENIAGTGLVEDIDDSQQGSNIEDFSGIYNRRKK